MAEYPVLTICGSMRYFDRMLELAHELTGTGYIVLMPFVIKGGQEGDEKFGQMLDDMHKRKIDMSELVVIVGAHRGESTTSELEYAQKHGKAILEVVGAFLWQMRLSRKSKNTFIPLNAQ